MAYGLNITFKERLTCKVMSHLAYNKTTDCFYRCWRNDRIMDIAAYLLKDQEISDPVEFAATVVTMSNGYFDPEDGGLSYYYGDYYSQKQLRNSIR